MTSEQRAFPRTPNTQTASWFLDIASSGKLNLNPPYQRRSVWNLDYRQFFIDSVLRNYPTQSIFLDVDIDPDRPTQYKVLDGKQRLTTLITFTKDEFSAPESLADLGLSDMYYSDFPREMKTRLLNYLFTVESVSEVTAAELNQAFDRLNRNVARLNKQELRHAQYGGRFITKMERFAEDTFWEEVGLVTAARRRRMLDVEYVSEFYTVSLRGIQDGKDYLDRIYSECDLEIPDEQATDKLFRSSVEVLAALNAEISIPATRFRNVADFYSLWAAITTILKSGERIDPSVAGPSLAKFQDEVNAESTRRGLNYLLAARQGSNKAPNRQRRADILSDVLKG